MYICLIYICKHTYVYMNTNIFKEKKDKFILKIDLKINK